MVRPWFKGLDDFSIHRLNDFLSHGSMVQGFMLQPRNVMSLIVLSVHNQLFCKSFSFSVFLWEVACRGVGMRVCVCNPCSHRDSFELFWSAGGWSVLQILSHSDIVLGRQNYVPAIFRVF